MVGGLILACRIVDMSRSLEMDVYMRASAS